MQKYDFEFDEALGRYGWYVARGTEGEAALEATKRIHAEFDIRDDLVFCGRAPDDSDDRLYLVESGSPVEIARDFQVGSHAASYDENVAAATIEMLGAVFQVAPFTALVVNSACYQARFTRRINEHLAERVLRTMEQYHCHGMDYYASRFPDLADEDIIGSMVQEQRLHLWWD